MVRELSNGLQDSKKIKTETTKKMKLKLMMKVDLIQILNSSIVGFFGSQD